MILTISNVIPDHDLADIRKDMEKLQWRDGAETAGGMARIVKRNEQADLSSQIGKRLRERFQAALTSHPVVTSFARPLKFTRPMISRTRDGGGYGLHVDNPFMGSGAQHLRTDLSFTLFLNSPEDYEGGELSIEHSGSTQNIKENAGDVVIYPSTSLHQVKPVTSGERLVCIGWIESHVRSAEHREILFDLDNLKAELGKTHKPTSGELLMLSKTLANLKRMWMGN